MYLYSTSVSSMDILDCDPTIFNNYKTSSWNFGFWGSCSNVFENSRLLEH